MRICIIGAGVAGILAAKYAAENGYDFEVLERFPELGGTWVYSPKIGVDEYGYPIYSAMYQGLRTNLPKEVMSFPDYQAQYKQSFMSREEVLKFLNEFADKFHIRSKMRFNREVIKVEPVDVKDSEMEQKPTSLEKWKITSIDKPTNKEIEAIYDVLMVCAGIYHEPSIPSIPGKELFKGTQTHSNCYRNPEPFKNKRVLVIGAGPSAKDIILAVSPIAQYVWMSHHCELIQSFKNNAEFNRPIVVEKPDVKRILGAAEVEFEDGSKGSFDSIVYCTGYKYRFPFLSTSCGLTIEDFHVKPLYKHIILIGHPNLAFIGLPSHVCAFRMMDLQCRFYMKYLDGTMTLPTELEMLEDAQKNLERRRRDGLVTRHVHCLGKDQERYFQELAETAGIENIPGVILTMWEDSVRGIYGDFYNFRNYNYTVIDECSYVKTPVK